MVEKAKDGGTTQLSKKKNQMHQTLARPEVSDLIGERLRTFYDEVAKQPVPDRFVELLKQLEAANPPEEET
jgi:Anti-sigma factor NepR